MARARSEGCGDTDREHWKKRIIFLPKPKARKAVIGSPPKGGVLESTPEDMFPMRSLFVVLVLALASPVRAGKHDPNDPTGVHLSFGVADDEMVVTWATFAETNSDLRYAPMSSSDGTEPAHLDKTAYGTSSRFVDYGEAATVRYIHVVTLTGLDPGVRYWYQVGDGSLSSKKKGKSSSWSKTFWFAAKRSPAQFSEEKPLRIIALCDIGLQRSEVVLRELAKLVHTGDGANGDGQPIDAFVQCGDFAYDLDDGAAFPTHHVPQTDCPYSSCEGTVTTRRDYSLCPLP